MGSPESSKDAEPSREELPDCRIWLIDGYNVLHASLGGQDRSEWWTAARRHELLARLRSFERPDRELWVVFDGPRPAPTDSQAEPSQLRLVFAPSADEWIRRTLREAPDPSVVAVVTGDRPVRDRARHRGAQVVAPRALLACCPV